VQISSLFYPFATPSRFLSIFQLLVNNELFHQPSFCQKIFFHQSSFYSRKVIYIFLREKRSGGKFLGGKCPRLGWTYTVLPGSAPSLVPRARWRSFTGHWGANDKRFIKYSVSHYCGLFSVLVDVITFMQ